MTLLLSRHCNIHTISEGFSSNKKNTQEKKYEVENGEEESNEEKITEEQLKKKKEKKEKSDLILESVKEDFITKLLGDGLIQKKKNKNKETFETKIPKYKVDTNVDQKINQLDKAIQLFKQQLG